MDINNLSLENYTGESSFVKEPDFFTILELARSIFNVKYAYITRITDNYLNINSHNQFREVNIKCKYTFCHDVITSGEIKTINDIRQDPRYLMDVEKYQKLGYCSYAGAPVYISKGKIFGTLCLFDDAPRNFCEKDKEELKLLSHQVGSFLNLHNIAKKYEDIAANLYETNLINQNSKAILHTMHDGILVQDFNGNLIETNPAALQILGYDAKKFDAIDTYAKCKCTFTDEYNKPIVRANMPMAMAVSNKRSYENIIIGVTGENGKKSWLMVSSTPVFNQQTNDVERVITCFTDITQNQKDKENLRRISKIAEEASSTKSAFIANISHEIRTPLNGVIGIAEALAKTTLDNNQSEMVYLIKSAGQTINALMNELLDMSKIEAGKLTLENTKFDLYETVSSAANLIKIKADAKNIGYEINFDQSLNRYYYGDIIRIKQIITNLTSNAVKFTPKGKVTIDVSPLSDQEGFKIAVKDTGIGIKKADIPKLFGRFSQADATITRRFGGTGLGLSICRELLKLMGGTINVTSKPNEGSCFTATFPLKKASDNIEVSYNTYDEPQSDVVNNQKISVLVADDNELNQKVFKLLTEPMGFDITAVKDGAEAVDKIKNNDYDLIFMDMNMPKIDGISATKSIISYENERKLPHTSIVMLSGNDSDSFVKQSLAAGADYFLAKPIDIKQLASVINRILK